MDFYRRAGKETSANICQAEAMEMEEAFEEAGDLFLDIGSRLDAERCYWKGKCWTDLSLMYLSYKPVFKLYKLIASVMMAPNESSNAINMIRYLLQSIKDGRKPPLSETQFQDGARTAFKCLVAGRQSDSQEENVWLEISELLDHLPALVSIVGYHKAAQIYFYAKQYGEAIRCWDASAQRNTNDYYFAHAKVATEPNEKIYWLDQAKAIERIIQEYSLANREELEESTKKICANALRSKHQYIESIEIYHEIGDTKATVNTIRELIRDNKSKQEIKIINNLIRDVYEDSLQQHEFQLAYDLIRNSGKIFNKAQLIDFASSYIQTLMQVGKWEEALRFVIPYKFERKDIKRNSFPKIGRMKDIELLRLQTVFIKEFALNPPDTKIREKNLLTDFFIDVQRPGYPYWGQEIRLREFAVVLERTGKNIDVLPFYERILEQGISVEDQKFVQVRWLRVKVKQIERAGKEEQNKNKRLYEKQFEGKLKEWRISSNAIAIEPEFPDVILYDEIEAIEIPNFEITWDPPSCLLKDPTTNATVIIDVANGSIAKFKIDFDVSERDKIKEFKIAKWNLSGVIFIGQRLKITANGNTQTFKIE